MRFPPVNERLKPVNERLKEAPAHALRAMFAGVGQLLLVTDRLRNRPAGYVPRPRNPEPAAPAVQEMPSAAAAPSPQPAASGHEPSTTAAASSPPATARANRPATGRAPTADGHGRGAAETRGIGDDQTAAEGRGGSTGSAPPLPNYDELSIPSLRARLRSLSVAQVNELIEYEKAHANRQDVIAMYERRAAKLTAADG